MSTRDRKGRRPRQDRRDFSRTAYNDPPPRFANRRNLQENYDSNKFSNNYGSSNQGGGESGFSPRKERDRQMNYGSRSYSSKMYGNDDQLPQLLAKLENASTERCCRTAQQVLNYMEQADNKAAVMQSMEQLQSVIDRVIVSRQDDSLYETLASCVGRLGAVLGGSIHNDALHWYLHWVFVSVNITMEGRTDKMRSVYLNGFNEALELEGNSASFVGLIPAAMDSLQQLLEVVETPELLESVVKLLMTISKQNPHSLNQYFKNTVDILVGWHIDTCQEDNLIQFISDALKSMKDYWKMDMSFSLNLLKQFLEDMEAYSNELTSLSGMNESVSLSDEASTPEQCLSKLVALLRAFTTVLSGIGEQFSPARYPGITSGYVNDLLSRVISGVVSANCIQYSEELLIAGNTCLLVMCQGLQSQFAACTEATGGFILQQFGQSDPPSLDHAFSVVKLVLQMVEELQNNLPTAFVQQMLSINGPIASLRHLSNQRLLGQLLKIYQKILSTNNIPLIDTVYQIIIADVTNATKHLDPAYSDKSPSPERDMAEAENSSQQFLTTQEAQAAIICDLSLLPNVMTASRSVKGLWQPKPSVYGILMEQLTLLLPTKAAEFPAVHYSFLHALFQDCHSNGHYIPGATSGRGVSPIGSLTEVLLLLSKQLQLYSLPFDICRLVHRWIDFIVERLVANKDKAFTGEVKKNMDMLITQLITFTFSRDHTIRLEVVSLLKVIIQSQLISDHVISKHCLPEIVVRLCDTKGEIRAAYSALLEVIPTYIITSYGSGMDTKDFIHGRKGLDALRTCRGTWLARKSHMTKVSQCTFHKHHFKAIMGFITHGLTPSKHLPDDWLERMFHSCQHRYTTSSHDIHDHPENHPMLMSHMACNCDVVLWFWATYESAQYCLLSRLRTPLGGPGETFQVIENVIHGYAQEVEASHDARHHRDTPSSFSGLMGAGLGPRHYTVHLRAILLLQFIEHLDKLMYNAYEGSSVTFPSPPKAIRGFFRMNRGTCQEWLSRIRANLVVMAIHAGLPAAAVRHGYEALILMEHNPHTMEFWVMLVRVVQALIQLGAWEAIHGISMWCKNHIGIQSWIDAGCAQAKGSYEIACDNYLKCLNALHSMDDSGEVSNSAPIIKFIVNQVYECYIHIKDVQEAESWYTKRVVSMKEQVSPSMAKAFTIHHDINNIQALGKFESGDLGQLKEVLERQADLKRDPDIQPLWDPYQLLNASRMLFLRSVVPWGDGSGSDDNATVEDGMTTDHSNKSSSLKRWLKLSSAYAESPLRVGSLEWPLRMSPSHALQLQVAATFRALNPVKSQQSSSSGLLLYSLPTKSLDPRHHEAGVWNDVLRIQTHVNNSNQSDDSMSQLLLESVRLARLQSNQKRAYALMWRHILTLIGEQDATSINQTIALQQFNTSQKISMLDRLRVQRELAKLHFSTTKLQEAIEMMALSVVTYCTEQDSAGSQCSELAARSLLSLVKWLQTDSRFLQSAWKQSLPSGHYLHSIILQEEECRQQGMGLYKMEYDLTSSNLFAPKESRFDRYEFAIGQLLHLATIFSPMLAKSWWSLAGWCYRIGRKNLEALSSTGTTELLENEKLLVMQALPKPFSDEDVNVLYNVLGQVHVPDNDSDDDLRAKEDVKHDYEEDSKAISKQLLSVCPQLETLPSLDPLLSVWHRVRTRLFIHYQLAARAYFKFLQLSGATLDPSTSLDDMNVTASLRLLRLLVKYAGELKAELEQGFSATPTKPWKGIIPQLFSRLSHPEPNVRQSVSDLLCRVARDSPHFIIYPAIVGASRRNQLQERKSTMPGLLAERHDNSEPTLDGEELLPGTDPFSPPDNPHTEVEQDDDDDDAMPTTNMSSLEKSLQVILDSLVQHNPALVTEVRNLVAELCRVTLLWDEMWLAALMQRQGEVHRRLHQIEVEAKRTLSMNILTHAEKQAILREKYNATMKPLLWVLEHMAYVTSQHPETHNERIFQTTFGETISQALEQLRRPDDYTNPQQAWEPFKEFQQLLMHRSQKRMAGTISLHEVSPHLAAISSSCITMPGLESRGDSPVTLESIDLEVSILPTKTKPKKISMIGSDGRRHTYLFKGLEDLHLDERIMQFMAIINNMFARDNKHGKPVYHARDYAVTPLGARSGLIQWVDSSTPLFGLYKRWQQREAIAMMQPPKQVTGSQPAAPQLPPQVLKPNELFYSKIIPLLKEKGLSESTPRKDWPHTIQLQVLEELMQETPNYLLSRELWCASTCASEWWSITQTYCRSTAVMSMIGYIIGLGDRHLDNLLIEFSTGQVVHVDYNVCFEKGRSLRVPEKVPFRMTQNLEHAMGFSGVEGTFRLSCEDIMRILRRGRETLLTLLEAFVYDPLIDWTQSEDAAFPLAVRGPSEGVGLQSRKEMEKEVAESLLVTRLAETHTLWEKSRLSLCSVLQSLEVHLSAIATTTEHLCDHQDQQTRLDQQVDILREALQSPNHPLITMQDRLSDQAKLLMEQKRYTQQLMEQYNEQVMWHERHSTAVSKLTADEMSKLLEALQQQIDLGPAAYEPSSEFLQSTGQAQTIETCQQLEVELHKLLTRRRAGLTGCLGALHNYQRITAHLPAVRPSSSTVWKNTLASVIDAKQDNNAIVSCCQDAIKSFQATLKSPPPPRIVMAIDAKFRKQLQELHNRMSKLNDRHKGLSVSDVGKLETTVAETHTNLMKFCRDFGQSGTLALSCFVVIAVCPLNRRWLFMEQTAQSAGVRLSELNSREGDWFLDELCTMSGNVSQMISLLENCFEELNQEAVDTMQLAMNVVHTTNKVYSQLQGVISTFQSIIVPEALNHVVYEDAEMLQLLKAIKSITVSSQPGVSLRSLLDTLNEEYHQAAVKEVEVSASTQESLDEIEQQFNDLLTPDVAGEAPSAAQMVLSGLNNLFLPVEHATSQLYKLVDKMTVLEDWNSVDIIGQSDTIKGMATGNSYLKELFFIKRIVAVLDFCHELTALRHAMRADPIEREVLATTPTSSPAGTSTSRLHLPSEHHLSLPIRRYISDTVVNQLLGQPSHSLACVLMVAVGALGVTLTKDTPLTLEDACRMAHENNQSSITGTLIQQAKALFSAHDIAWREWDKTKRLRHNMDLCQQSIHRLTLLTQRFQWRYEQLLAQPDANYPWVGPPKSSCLTIMKKALSDELSSSITSTRDKMMSQNFRISQRLQWAAGANSALNSVLDEFQRATNRRAQALSVEEELCDQVVELCSAIVHLESTSSLTATPTPQDKNLIGLLHKYGNIAKELQACMEELSQVSDILPNLELPVDGQAVTTVWMKQRLEDLDSERNKILSEKKMANNNLARSKESALAELDKVRSLNRSYRKLMFDIWMHLTSLAKLEGPPSTGVLEPGPRAFIATQEKFNNDTKGLVQAAQDIIAANMSLAKPTRTSRSTVEQFNQLKETTSSLWALADWLLSQLSSFTNQLFTNPLECGPLKWAKPPVPTSYLLPKSHSSSSVAAAALQPLPPSAENEQAVAGAAAAKMYRSVKGVVRDPKTGKALQEQNSYAVGVWRRVKAKLDGRDGIDNTVRMTVSEQVDKVIGEAVNPDNLCELYEGWTPWV